MGAAWDTVTSALNSDNRATSIVISLKSTCVIQQRVAGGVRLGSRTKAFSGSNGGHTHHTVRSAVAIGGMGQES